MPPSAVEAYLFRCMDQVGFTPQFTIGCKFTSFEWVAVTEGQSERGRMSDQTSISLAHRALPTLIEPA